MSVKDYYDYYSRYCEDCYNYNHFDPCNHCSRNQNARLEDIENRLSEIERRLPEIAEMEGLRNKLAEIANKKSENVGNFTTGPVLTSLGVNSIKASVLNNTNAPADVNITLYDITTNPKTPVSPSPVKLTVEPGTSAAVTFTTVPARYEVQFLNLRPGMYAYTAGTIESSDILNCVNTFYHSDLAPMADSSI